MNPRALMSVLFHADKAIDLIVTARDLGLLDRLDAGPVTLHELADHAGARPLRLYKFLDGLESLGLVARRQPTDDMLATTYVSVQPLAAAAEAVFGAGSIERDRDTYPWREVHGRMREVLGGALDTQFTWPPVSDAEIAGFERSMAAGCPPIACALRDSRGDVFGGARRWLDVGGGDGSLAAELLPELPGLAADVYNLPAVGRLVYARARTTRLEGRLGFVPGDFLVQPLPRGYDVLSFVRVLHDWPPETARMLLGKARAALAPGGRLVVCEEFRTHDRLAVQLFWTYFLVGADACSSRLREVEWYTDALAGLGFADIRVVAGDFDLVLATAP